MAIAEGPLQINHQLECKKSPEGHETDFSAIAPWFAGALEAGGTIAFEVQKKPDQSKNAYPGWENR
jgi:hypothetical protein